MVRFTSIKSALSYPAMRAQSSVAPRGLIIIGQISLPACESISKVTTESLPPPMGTI